MVSSVPEQRGVHPICQRKFLLQKVPQECREGCAEEVGYRVQPVLEYNLVNAEELGR